VTHDPVVVRRQYASASGLAARASLYANTTGSFAGDVAFEAVAERRPRRFLDVGCGRGWFGARLAWRSSRSDHERSRPSARAVAASRCRRCATVPAADVSAEHGEAALRRHVDHVHDASGTVTIADRAAILRYLRSGETLAPWVELLPAHVSPPLVARRSDVAFVADAA